MIYMIVMVHHYIVGKFLFIFINIEKNKFMNKFFIIYFIHRMNYYLLCLIIFFGLYMHNVIISWIKSKKQPNNTKKPPIVKGRLPFVGNV